MNSWRSPAEWNQRADRVPRALNQTMRSACIRMPKKKWRILSGNFPASVLGSVTAAVSAALKGLTIEADDRPTRSVNKH